MARHDVVVIGSGVIGLSVAWRLAATGRSVTCVDPRPGRGSSYVAAGMLAPVTEASWGEEELVALNLRAMRSWPDFARALEGAGGLGVGLIETGTLLVAADAGDQAVLEDLLGFHRHLGLDSSWLAPSQCRTLEPLLAPGLRGGILAAGDHQVDNRRLLGALAAACARAGVAHLARRVDALISTGGRATGVVADGEELDADVVVLAAGHCSGTIGGLDAALLPPVRPVKGEILRLRHPAGDPVLTHTVRGVVAGRSVYLVPRGDGRIVCGATSEERSDDRSTVGAAYQLLRDATRIVPALLEVDLEETNAGLRPGAPDNTPLVGPSALAGLVLATGHYRNGILLAPLTADAVVAVLEDGALPDWAHALDPARYSGTDAQASP